MGIADYIKAGADFKRETITFSATTEGERSGSINLGSAYALLAMRTSVPCRVRLYDNLDSRDNATEIARVFGDTNIPPTVALVGDFSMSLANTTYTTDPVLYGVVADPDTNLTYYRIDNTAALPVDIAITSYPIEDTSIAIPASNRRTITNIAIAGLNTTTVSSSVIADSSIPKTYLLVSASLEGSSNRARVRLYSMSSSLTLAGEKTRPFNVEPTSSAVGLIADMLMTGSETIYFSPKIVGMNIDNIGPTLSKIKFGSSGIYSKNGENELYVHVENKRGVTADVNVSLHLYALED